MQSLRLGLVGSGFISQFHLKAIEQVRGLTISGLTKRSTSDKLAGYAREKSLGNAVVYPTVEELCQHSDVIGLYSPNFSKVEVMEEIVHAKRKGAPIRAVIVDKPLGRNVKEAKRMCQLAEEGGLLTAYFENQIYMKAIQAQRRQLEATVRRMGPLTLTRSAEEHGGPHNGWFWDPTQQGGGVLSDMGCHSIAVGWYLLNPPGKPLTFLQPETVSCDLGLLKWGQPQWAEKLKTRFGIDYTKAPAEDFATGIITFRNPETNQRVKAQFTDSWMFEKQGLRLFMDGMGPGYAFEINTLTSPLTVFIGNDAMAGVSDQELALEKSTSDRGLLAVQPNEADLYGYVDENQDAFESFMAGKDAMLPFSYGLEITRLVMASYMAGEQKRVIDLTKPEERQAVDNYIPLIQQGRGSEVLF